MISAFAAPTLAATLPEDFIRAEIQVESGGNNLAIGDKNLAIGVLQIHLGCWKDAIRANKSIGGKYADCFKRAYSIQIMNAYLNKYCPNAVIQSNYEIMARTWNGGHGGMNNARTIKYWRKVEKVLKNP